MKVVFKCSLSPGMPGIGSLHAIFCLRLEVSFLQWSFSLAVDNFAFQLSFFTYSQDSFDHDKGQKSAISGRRLHRIFLNFLQWIFGENCPISGRRKKRRILSRLWLSWFFSVPIQLCFLAWHLQFELFYLQLERFCLQWESASTKHLKGL